MSLQSGSLLNLKPQCYHVGRKEVTEARNKVKREAAGEEEPMDFELPSLSARSKDDGDLLLPRSHSGDGHSPMRRDSTASDTSRNSLGTLGSMGSSSHLNKKKVYIAKPRLEQKLHVKTHSTQKQHSQKKGMCFVYHASSLITLIS